MDEATRDFNFWTHQINIFFIKKLFPAYEHMQDVLALGAKIQLEKQVSFILYLQNGFVWRGKGETGRYFQCKVEPGKVLDSWELA